MQVRTTPRGGVVLPRGWIFIEIQFRKRRKAGYWGLGVLLPALLG